MGVGTPTFLAETQVGTLSPESSSIVYLLGYPGVGNVGGADGGLSERSGPGESVRSRV